MVLPYKVTGQKRKKKEKYDIEEESEHLDDNDIPQSQKKAKIEGLEGSELDKEKAEQVFDEMPWIPIVPADMFKKPGVIFILERASLEIGKVGKVRMVVCGGIGKFVGLYWVLRVNWHELLFYVQSYQLLSSDEHANYFNEE